MATAIATTDTPTGCVTRYSTTSLEAGIPAWLDRSLITATVFYAPDNLPARSGPELRSAAARYTASIAHPAVHDEITAALADLRLQTIVRDENPEEARTRFRLLRRAVADVSIHVLEEACSRYARHQKFFPTAVAELLNYTASVEGERKWMANRLSRLADAADAADRERDRLANDPVTPEDVAAIKAEFGIKGDPMDARPGRGPRPEPKEPTADDYVQIFGMSRQDAEAAVSERARILARQPAQPDSILPELREQQVERGRDRIAKGKAVAASLKGRICTGCGEPEEREFIDEDVPACTLCSAPWEMGGVTTITNHGGCGAGWGKR